MIDVPESKSYWIEWAQIALITEREAQRIANERSVNQNRSGTKWHR